MIIYKVTSPSNKIYIGITTKSLDIRKKEHLKSSRHWKQITLYKAFNKYGFENFIWEVIDTAEDLNQLREKEKFYIQKYDSFNNGYNSTLGGDGIFGYKQTEKTKKDLSAKSKTQWNNMSDKDKQTRIKNNLTYRGQNKITIKDNFGNEFNSLTAAAKHYNLCVAAISMAIKHNYATRSGVKFEKVLCHKM